MLATTVAASFALAAPAIVPRPLSITPNGEAFTFDSSVVLVADKRARSTALVLKNALEPAMGWEIPVGSRGGKVVRFKFAGKDWRLGEEGYRLTTKSKEIVVEASTERGLFYGVQSLRQLLPAANLRRSPQTAEWSIPGGVIEDMPRFRWRGSHLDSCRHFMPKSFVLKYIDQLAFHKMNTFHWHLTDDQGWRIEIKKYPKLTTVGGWRKDSTVVYSPRQMTGKPHGGFYTQDDIREVVAYAKARHITVVPEIEMPGHAQAAIAAYPELGNTGQPIDVWTNWGVSTSVFNVKDGTISFLKDVLTEVMDLFPSQFIHVGGDECPKDEWKTSADVQARMKQLGLKDEHEMQSWFIRQFDSFLASKGRRLIGWSEILEGGLAPGAALMVWLGDDGALQAVRSGHDVVMAQGTTYYDAYQSGDRTTEPHAIGGNTDLKRAYEYEPIRPGMTPEQEKHVLGVQCQLWTEYIPDPQKLEYMAFPRLSAMSEIGWTTREQRDYADFEIRMKAHRARLEAMDINFRGRGNTYPYPLASPGK